MPCRAAIALWLGAAACWAALLAAGAFWIRSRPADSPPGTPTAASPAACLDTRAKAEHASFPAVRALVVNHRIGEGDLDWTSPSTGAQKAQFLSQYASCAVKPGERVVVKEVRAAPAVAPSAGRVTFPLPVLDAHLRGEINAGATIDVFNETQPIARGLRVLAVDCTRAPSGSVGDCRAILDAGADDVLRLQNARVDALRIVMLIAKS
jgi:hypothetical protein